MSTAPPFSLTDTDRQILSMTDDQFVPHDWEDRSVLIGMLYHINPL